jgi:hypothetical protein
MVKCVIDLEEEMLSQKISPESHSYIAIIMSRGIVASRLPISLHSLDWHFLKLIEVVELLIELKSATPIIFSLNLASIFSIDW